MTRQLVVGAVIVDSLDRPTRVLAARRSRPAELAGQWEFPGGKVEAGETPEQALVREVAEELGVRVVVGAELAHPDGAWPVSTALELRLFLAEITHGEPVHGETHDEVRWLPLADLDQVTWLPADAAALSRLRSWTSTST